MCGQDHPYKRVVDQNLWNDKRRLSPTHKKYHLSCHTFRKNVKDLALINFQGENA